MERVGLGRLRDRDALTAAARAAARRQGDRATYGDNRAECFDLAHESRGQDRGWGGRRAGGLLAGGSALGRERRPHGPQHDARDRARVRQAGHLAPERPDRADVAREVLPRRRSRGSRRDGQAALRRPHLTPDRSRSIAPDRPPRVPRGLRGGLVARAARRAYLAGPRRPLGVPGDPARGLARHRAHPGRAARGPDRDRRGVEARPGARDRPRVGALLRAPAESGGARAPREGVRHGCPCTRRRRAAHPRARGRAERGAHAHRAPAGRRRELVAARGRAVVPRRRGAGARPVVGHPDRRRDGSHHHRAVARGRARPRARRHRAGREPPRRRRPPSPRPARPRARLVARVVAPRVIGMIPVLVVVSIAAFAAFDLLPRGDPAERLAGRQPSAEQVEAIRHEWGFDRGIGTQYLTMMHKAFAGRLVSYETGIEVHGELWRRLPRTLWLALGGIGLAAVAGVGLALMTAGRRRRTGALAEGAALVGVSLPVFWLGAVLVYLLGFELGVVPNGGYVPFADDPLEWLHHLILPWITVAIVATATYLLVARARIEQALAEDYTRAALAAGVGPRALARRALRPAPAPPLGPWGRRLPPPGAAPGARTARGALGARLRRRGRRLGRPCRVGVRHRRRGPVRGRRDVDARRARGDRRDPARGVLRRGRERRGRRGADRPRPAPARRARPLASGRVHTGLRAADEKMRAAGVSEAARAAFARRFARLLAGDSGEMHGDELEPVGELPAFSDLPDECDPAVLDSAVVIKLNGGLGTSMGLSAPKSLIEVKPGMSFLEVIVRQVLALRRRHRARLPLVLMNSFSTRDATLAALDQHAELAVGDLPLDFLQSREPKLDAATLEPIEWPRDPALEWAPPGHGDIYAALAGSGMLGALLERGYEYAFVSNSDNLGAVLEPRVLSWFAAERLPFLMEVAEGVTGERKGGHIARRDGRLVLRETAQVPDGDDSFADHRRWRYYNTNNLWFDLRALDERREPLDLPLIVNHKPADPADPQSPEVVQLESALGAAVGAIDGAAALCVPRTRFAPVKTTNYLLVVWSDASVPDPGDARDLPAPERAGMGPPLVDLDPRYFKLLSDFEARFPSGPPSLVRAERLVVRGDVVFP